jgi:HEAT repeat protein
MNAWTSTGAVLAAWLALPAVALPAAVIPQESAPAVRQRLAAAQLAQSRGDFAVAERELDAAQQIADGEQKADVERARRALRSLSRPEQHYPSTPAEAGRIREVLQERGFGNQGRDPVQDLIATLNTGPWDVGAVQNAWSQLLSLRGLMVPPLVEALPRLGPFGLQNAIALLDEYEDERITKALMTLLDRRTPEVATLIANSLTQMAKPVALPLAERLIQADQPARVRVDAFRALVRCGVSEGRLTALAQELVAVPQLHTTLWDTAQSATGPWVDAILTGLALSPTEELRAATSLHQLRRAGSQDEASVLAILAQFSDPVRAQAAHRLVREHPEWARVAAIGLAAPAANLVDLGAVHWWRAPDAAASALLAYGCKGPSRDPAPTLAGLVANGWRAKPEHETRLVEFARKLGESMLLASALPDEARALALLATNDPLAIAVARHAVKLERPWHRLIVRQLAARDLSDGIALELIARDWSGIDATAAGELAAIVVRGVSIEPNAMPRVAARQRPEPTWEAALRQRFEADDALPVEVILPLVRDRSEDALVALAKRDPRLALREAAAWPVPPRATAFVHLVAPHAEAADLPFLLGWLASGLELRSNRDATFALLAAIHRCGVGHPDVIALGTDAATSDVHELALAAAGEARIDDLPRLLVLLPTLDWGIIVTANRVLGPQLRAEHSSLLLTAMERSLPAAIQATSPEQFQGNNRPGGPTQVGYLLQHLVRLGEALALPFAERIVAEGIGDPELVKDAAAAAIRLGGDRRHLLLTQLLRDDRLGVVAAALAAPELAADPSLRATAIAAWVRVGDRLGDQEKLAAMLRNFSPEERTEVAAAILANDRATTLSRDVCRAALSVLQEDKDAGHLDVLARIAKHPDYEVRLTVAGRLGRTFDRAAAPHLIDLLKDDHLVVAELAKQSLERIASYLDARSQWEQRLK